MRLYVGFFLFFLAFVVLNVTFLDSLRKIWGKGFPLILFIINLDLLILIIVFAIFFRKFIKTYLFERKGKLRVKLSNALFFYVIVPIIFLNFAVALLLFQYTKTMLASPLKDVYIRAEQLFQKVSELEENKINTYRNFFSVVLLQGQNPEDYKELFKDIKSVNKVKSCKEETTQELFVLCVENYQLVISRDKETIRLLNTISSTAKHLRNIVKSRDFITGVHVYFIIFITFITFLAYIWFANLVARYISFPIEKLSQKAQEIARGNFDVSLGIPKRNDEIDLLTESFIKMKEDLKKLYQRLEKEKEILKKLIENLPVGIAYIQKTDPPIINEAFYQLTDLKNLGELEKADLTKKSNLEVRKIQIGEGIAYVVYDIEPYILSERFKTWQEAVKRIAHEIKNPLTPISLNLERIIYLMQKEVVDKEKITESVQIMLREIERIKKLINQFRSLSTEGKPTFQRLSLRNLIEDLKKLYTVLNIDIQGDKIVNGDINLLKDMYMNLFNNSLEWGSTSVQIQIEEEKIIYKDNGKGIEKGMEEVIFSPYHSENPQGFGLGLSIVKHIANLHGWKLKAIPSEEGFIVIFNLSNQAEG